MLDHTDIQNCHRAAMGIPPEAVPQQTIYHGNSDIVCESGRYPLLSKAGYLTVTILAAICAPTMAAHVKESPAHAPTRAAFHALHESLVVDSLRSIRHMTRDARPANARTREGDLK